MSSKSIKRPKSDPTPIKKTRRTPRRFSKSPKTHIPRVSYGKESDIIIIAKQILKDFTEYNLKKINKDRYYKLQVPLDKLLVDWELYRRESVIPRTLIRNPDKRIVKLTKEEDIIESSKYHLDLRKKQEVKIEKFLKDHEDFIDDIIRAHKLKKIRSRRSRGVTIPVSVSESLKHVPGMRHPSKLEQRPKNTAMVFNAFQRKTKKHKKRPSKKRPRRKTKRTRRKTKRTRRK